jgi:hypothetical protein
MDSYINLPGPESTSVRARRLKRKEQTEGTRKRRVGEGIG